MKRYIRCNAEDWFKKDWYKPEDGWTPEDIELHKSIDWKARNYEDYMVEDDSFNGVAILYGIGSEPVLKHTKFYKFIRSNGIFPPYYAPAERKPFDEKYRPYVGPMYDGRKHKSYDIHDRYETQSLYDALFD